MHARANSETIKPHPTIKAASWFFYAVIVLILFTITMNVHKLKLLQNLGHFIVTKSLNALMVMVRYFSTLKAITSAMAYYT